MKRDRWLWAILLAGAAVRLYGLGERSLSYDECQQFWASRGNVLVSNREITLDPPLFAAVLRLHSLPGRSEIWLRLLPCLFGILAIPAVYALARAATSDLRCARTATALFALAPYPIRYAQSLRVYSLTLLLCALLPASYLAARKEDRPRRWGILALVAGAALLTMYGAVWLLLGMAVLLLLEAFRGQAAVSRRGILALATGAAAALPFYLLSLPTQLHQGTPASFYEDKFLPAGGLAPAAWFLARGTLDLFSYYSFIHPATGVLFGLLALLGMAALARHRDSGAVAALFAFGVAAAAAASTLRLYPYGGTRQMLFAEPLFCVCAGAGIEALRPRARGLLSAGILAAAVLGCGIFLYRYHTEPGGQEMRPVAEFLAGQVRAGDRILVNKDAIPQFRFYYHGSPQAVVLGKETVIRDYLSEINRILGAASPCRWWLVFSHGWSDGRRAELAAVDPRFGMTEKIEAHQAAAYLLVPRPPAGSAPAQDARP